MKRNGVLLHRLEAQNVSNFRQSARKDVMGLDLENVEPHTQTEREREGGGEEVNRCNHILCSLNGIKFGQMCALRFKVKRKQRDSPIHTLKSILRDDLGEEQETSSKYEITTSLIFFFDVYSLNCFLI